MVSAPARNRRHLGIGWAIPLRPIAGRLQYARYEDDIEQAITLILETTPRERVMLPEFGSGLSGLLFSPNSPVTHRLVESAVRSALLQWEPRIAVEDVRAQADEAHPSLVLVEIDYVVRRSNTFYNRVYPFYLTQREG